MFERASRDKAIARDNDDDQAPTNVWVSMSNEKSRVERSSNTSLLLRYHDTEHRV